MTRMKYQELTRDELKVSARLGAMEMLRAGVTTARRSDGCRNVWEAMKEFGLQGVAYQEVFGPAEPMPPNRCTAACESRNYRKRGNGDAAGRRVARTRHIRFRELFRDDRGLCAKRRRCG